MPAYADFSDAAVHAMLNAMPSVDGGTAKWRTGTAPGIGNARTGTLLVTHTLNATAFAAAATRQRLANSIADAYAVAPGIAGYVTLETSGGTAVLEMRAGGSLIATFSSSAGLLITTTVAHGYTAGTAIQFYVESGALPANVVVNTDYYVTSVTSTTFKIEAQVGGGAIAFVDAGSGTLRSKLANVAAALQSSDGSVAAGVPVGVSSMALRMPNVSV